MAIREDLIEGAITFLQDPSVASAPIDQRIAFLRSKNLTQEEIDVSLARVSGQAAPPPSQAYPRQQQQQYYPQQQQQQYWPQQPPPELPRRDWRDYFIIATVVGGVGYGLYWTAARYLTPLLAPPTPPQLEADKASIDSSFERAFALLDQLSTDTAELKEAEKARSERLDTVLQDVESVLQKLRSGEEEREVEGKRVARELEGIRELVPKALAKEREREAERLAELGTEMKSLKTLVASRMPGASGTGNHGIGGRSVPSYLQNREQQASTPAVQPASTNGDSGPAPPASSTSSAEDKPSTSNSTSTPTASSILPERTASSSPYGRFSTSSGGAGKSPAIPAWQLAAKKRNEEQAQTQKSETSASAGVQDSGTQASVEEGKEEGASA
jgi:peroxin-14